MRTDAEIAGFMIKGIEELITYSRAQSKQEVSAVLSATIEHIAMEISHNLGADHAMRVLGVILQHLEPDAKSTTVHHLQTPFPRTAQ